MQTTNFLGLVASYLVVKNRELIVGRAIRREDADKLTALLQADPAVEHVAVQHAVVTGTTSYSIRAELDFDGHYLAKRYLEERDIDALHRRVAADSNEFRNFLGEYGEAVMDQVADEIDRIEERIREVLPKAQQIDLEPD